MGRKGKRERGRERWEAGEGGIKKRGRGSEGRGGEGGVVADEERESFPGSRELLVLDVSWC